MRSPKLAFVWLLAKECRELVALKAWWVLLLAIGPLTGISFIRSVQTYAEVSGLNGTSAGVGEALSPLIGVWAPTFSACELAAVFLLPFVAIGLIAGDRQNGALKLELQQSLGSATRIAAKALVLLAGWIIAMLAPLSAILLWKYYGGFVYTPELAVLTLGQILNAGLTIGLASAMAAFSDHNSTAAILTLSVTVGTWILSFFGAIEGGWWERAAGYTPAAMVAQFQHGLISLDVALTAIFLTLTGLTLAAIWTRLGVKITRRALESTAALLIAAILIGACTFLTPSWDTSESRGNSFPESDEQALRTLRAPLTIEVHLAPEDPRRADLDTRALSKLRRLLPNLKVRNISATSIGLFEQSAPGYGEIWYDLAGSKIMSRSTTAEGVLEAIYALARISPPAESDDEIFRGHPLATEPRGAALLYYAIWPGVFLVAGISLRKRLQ